MEMYSFSTKTLEMFQCYFAYHNNESVLFIITKTRTLRHARDFCASSDTHGDFEFFFPGKPPECALEAGNSNVRERHIFTRSAEY